MYNCPKCRASLGWIGDHNYEDVHGYEEGYVGIYSMWECPECGTEVNFVDRWKDDGNELS
jgi:predicted RNA-binding Zn-ribbon protein involved in translation (DUF1610 family)